MGSIPNRREVTVLIRDVLNLKGGSIYSVEPAAALTEVVALMVGHDIGSLVVMDNGRMCGMLTFREVLQALDAQGGNLADMRARDVMVRDPICGTPADTIDDLREIMTQHHVRYLPVRDGQKLIGIISFHDVAKAIIKETRLENRLLKRYIEHTPESDPEIRAAAGQQRQ
jgi:predicted transcriptional regulator